MLDLIEELEENATVFILLETDKNLLYGEYLVVERKNGLMRDQYAKIQLVNTPKKARYFRNTIEFKGFRIEFPHTPNTYNIFDNYDEMVKEFCKKLKRKPEANIKLYKKLKNKYPIYFR